MKKLIVILAITSITLFACTSNQNKETDKFQKEEKGRENKELEDTIKTEDLKKAVDLSEVNVDETEDMVLYWKEYQDSYIYYIDWFPSNQTTVLAEIDSIAREILWNEDFSDIYIISNNGIYQTSLFKENSSIMKLNDVPTAWYNYRSLGSWIDEENGNISLSYYYSIDEYKSDHVKKVSELDKDFIISPGSIIMGIIQLNEEGDWQTIIEKPVEYNPYGVTLGNVWGYVKEDDTYTSLSNIRESYTCGHAYHDWIMGKDAQAILGDYEYKESSAILKISINKNINLIPTVLWGDTPNYYTPIYIQNIETGELEKIKMKHQRLGLQVTNTHLIINLEGRNSNVWVYNLDDLTNKKVYTDCYGVIGIK